MGGMTAASHIADALRDQAIPGGPIEQLYRNNEVMGNFAMRPFTGGSTINTKNHYAGNSSVGTFDEGDAVGVAGAQSYLTARWPEKHYRGIVEITGHARDYLRDGSSEAAFFDQIGEESDRCVRDIVHRVSTDMLGTGTTAPVGIQGIVDDAGTVAGLSRSTYSWWAAYELAGTSTTVVVADIEKAMATSADTPYTGEVDQIWTSHTQARKFYERTGSLGGANGPLRQIVQGSGSQGPRQAGNVLDGIAFGGVNAKPMRNLTATVWLGLTTPDFFIGVMRDFQAKELGPVADSDRVQISCAYGLGCLSPRRSWKVTGYTDT